MVGEASSAETDDLANRLLKVGFRVGEDDPLKQAEANEEMAKVNRRNEAAAPAVVAGIDPVLRDERAKRAVEAGRKDREFLTPKPKPVVKKKPWWEKLTG